MPVFRQSFRLQLLRNIHRALPVLHRLFLPEAEFPVGEGIHAEAAVHDLRHILSGIQPRLRAVLPDPLKMQVSGEPEPDPVPVQELHRLLIVFQCAVPAEQLRLIEEVVVGHRDHPGSRSLRLLKALLHPRKGLRADPPDDPVFRRVDSGIQHHEPAVVPDFVYIGQGSRIPERRLVISEFTVDLKELVSRLRGGDRRGRASEISVCPCRRDVMVSRNDQDPDPLCRQSPELFRQFLMVRGLSVKA